MKQHHYTLVLLDGNCLYRMNYTGTRAGIPEGWAVHKRSAAL